MQKPLAIATMVALAACNAHELGSFDDEASAQPIKPLLQARPRESLLSFSQPMAFASVGAQLATSGDLVATSAPGDAFSASYAGAVYVHQLDSTTGAWLEQARLLPAADPTDLQFGRAIAIDGGTLVASTATTLMNAVQRYGSVYVFTRDAAGPGTWGMFRFTDTIVNSGGDFGVSLALRDDLVVVGAMSSTGEGSVMIFERDRGGIGAWGKVATITQADAGDTNGSTVRFGAAVALEGDDLLIGAPPENSLGSIAGAAYIFHRDAVDRDRWALGGTLSSPPGLGPINAMFGQPVALHDGVAAIGAPRDSWVDDVTTGGAIYAFRPDASGSWAVTKKIMALDATSGDRFGTAFSFAGNVLVAGAPGKTIQVSGQGAAYVFRKDDASTDAWYQGIRFAASDGALIDGFGSAIAIHDQTAFVGAPDRNGTTGTVLDDFGMVYADDITPPPPRQCHPASPATATLQDGGSVVATSAVTLAAPTGSLSAPVSVWISDIAAPAVPAPSTVTVVGGYVNLGSQCATVALPDHAFTLSFPVPTSADPTLLTVAYRVPTELVADVAPNGYLWDFVDGSYDASNGHYTIDIRWLASLGITYVLVERPAALPVARSVRSAATESCGGVLHPEILCHTAPELCGTGPLVEGFEDAYTRFHRYFKEPDITEPWLERSSPCHYPVYVYNRTDPVCTPLDPTGHPILGEESFYKTIDGRIVICPPTAGYSTDQLRALAAHELFHAFQTAYLIPSPGASPTAIDEWVYDSMAEAAVNSDTVMLRDPLLDAHDTLRSVSIPLSSEGLARYPAQDFWVHVATSTPHPGNESERRAYSLGYLGDFLRVGLTTSDIEKVMQISSSYRFLGFEYWTWAKNQAYEKMDVTFGGRLTNPCTLEGPSIIDAPIQIDYPQHNCASVNFTGPLQTKAVVVHVHNASNRLPVNASGAGVSFKVYKNGEADCDGSLEPLDKKVRGRDGQRTLVNVTAGTDVTVLLANRSTAASPTPLTTVSVGSDTTCH